MSGSAKILLPIFNFLVLAATTAELAVVLWLCFQPRTIGLLEGSPGFFARGNMYQMVVMWALVTVVVFLGCYGAINNSKLFLGLFFFFLLIICAGKVGKGIVDLNDSAPLVKDITDLYTQKYNNCTNNSNPQKTEELKKNLNFIHDGFQCCGTGTNNGCCTGASYPKTCTVAIAEVFNKHMKIISGLGIGTGAFLVFGLIFTIQLCVSG